MRVISDNVSFKKGDGKDKLRKQIAKLLGWDDPDGMDIFGRWKAPAESVQKVKGGKDV